MTTNKNQFRAVFLAALMVLSVIAVGFAFTGNAAAAVANDRDGTTVDAEAANDTRVYLGEQGITYQNPTFSDTATGDELFKVTGDNAGEPLGDVISLTQPGGTYNSSDDNITVTLVTPRITAFDVEQGGSGVNGGTIIQGTSADSFANVTYNFGEAENITISVEDANGLDVSSEFVNTSATALTLEPTTDNVSFELNPDAVDVGTYTITVEGAGDIDDGEAVQSTTVTVIDEEEAAISLNEDSVTKGEKVTFTVTGVQEESLVTVGIEVSDVSGYTAGGGSLAPDDVFRNVGDVSNTSSTNGDSITVSNTDYVVADYEIDGGQAVGSIDTSNLDSDDIDVYVWPDSATNVGDADEDDFTTLTVASATVTLDAIEGPYVIGSSIDISGSVSPNVDSVYVYARGSGDWEPVGSTDSADAYEITVDADNTFSESDFVLTAGTGGGNDLLSIPGNYRLGVADAADISDQSADLTTTLFNDNTTDQVSIVTTTGQLEADVTLYNGQIDNSHRELDIDGVDLQSAGDLVEVVFIGPRGTVENTTISVDDDGTFDSDITVAQSLNDGSVEVHVISKGRDGSFGSTLDFSSITGTQAQARAQVLDQTVDATASDDQIVSATFRLTNPRVAITDVPAEVAQGDTLTVSGETNTNPDDEDIIVELFDADGASELISTTDEWGSDGVWTVTFETSELPLGSYTAEVEVKDTSDTMDFAIVETVSSPEPEPEPEPEPTPEPEPEPEPTEEPAEEETPAETPGFGLLVALTALVAAGFLALRRLD